MTYQMLEHQKAGVQFLMNGSPSKGIGGLEWDTGTGKTHGALNFFKRVRVHIPNVKMLVICPISLLEKAWGDDIKKYFPEFKYYNIYKDYDFKKPLRVNPDIFLINFDSMLSEKYVKTLEGWIGGFGCDWICTLDESSKMKNFKSKTTKVLLSMRELFRFRVIMSGTMAPNSEMEYWAQICFLDKEALGSSFFAFRNRYFYLKNRYTGHEIPQGGRMTRAMAQEVMKKCDYVVVPSKHEELMRIIGRWLHSAKKKDCPDLPPTVDETRGIKMTAIQQAAYNRMKRDLILQLKDSTITAQVALTKVMKLRQITSGFIYDENHKHHALCETSPKLAELLSVIEESKDKQIIIWIQFHWELMVICHELYKRYGKDSVVTLGAKEFSEEGDMVTNDRDGSIQAFKENRARFIVAHPKSGAHGLTFINCHLQVFFSLDFSYENYQQCRGRTDRYGQTESTTYIHLIAEDTIDEEILEVLRGKGDAQQITYNLIHGKK